MRFRVESWSGCGDGVRRASGLGSDPLASQIDHGCRLRRGQELGRVRHLIVLDPLGFAGEGLVVVTELGVEIGVVVDLIRREFPQDAGCDACDAFGLELAHEAGELGVAEQPLPDPDLDGAVQSRGHDLHFVTIIDRLDAELALASDVGEHRVDVEGLEETPAVRAGIRHHPLTPRPLLLGRGSLRRGDDDVEHVARVHRAGHDVGPIPAVLFPNRLQLIDQ